MPVAARAAFHALTMVWPLVCRRLGSRGPVPFHTETKLAITDVILGCVGFVLEEFCENATLVDTAVKQAIDDVTELSHQTSGQPSTELGSASIARKLMSETKKIRYGYRADRSKVASQDAHSSGSRAQ